MLSASTSELASKAALLSLITSEKHFYALFEEFFPFFLASLDNFFQKFRQISRAFFKLFRSYLDQLFLRIENNFGRNEKEHLGAVIGQFSGAKQLAKAGNLTQEGDLFLG